MLQGLGCTGKKGSKAEKKKIPFGEKNAPMTGFITKTLRLCGNDLKFHLKLREKKGSNKQGTRLKGGVQREKSRA